MALSNCEKSLLHDLPKKKNYLSHSACCYMANLVVAGGGKSKHEPKKENSIRIVCGSNASACNRPVSGD